MTAPRTDRLSHILTDEASFGLTSDWIACIAADTDRISDAPEIHIVETPTWELTVASLSSFYGECGDDGDELMFRDRIAWYAMYDFVTGTYTEEDFRSSTTQDLAASIAEMLISDDPVESDECPLIVVHSGTAQEGGFIPLVRALHKEQTERGHDLAEVYVHDGTIESIRLFEESPVTIRQA